MRKLLIAALLFITTGANALTVEEEINKLEYAQEFQRVIVSEMGYTNEDVALLERISQNLYARKRFLEARSAAGETRYLVVNKGEYNMKVIDNGELVLKERVIIGKPTRPTPEFSDNIKYIVINPYWNVPRNLAKKDVVPKFNRIREKFGIEQMYTSIEEGGYRFFDGDVELDPHTIDFSQYDRYSDLPFKIRQDPGEHNSLGVIKFMFPNQYNVYIHDTPTRGLFDREKRNYSSGCVRLRNPANLAAYLMNTTTPDILNMIENEEYRDKWLRIPEPLPIHIVNWSITVTEDGIILGD